MSGGSSGAARAVPRLGLAWLGLFVCLFVCLLVCLFVCLLACLFVFVHCAQLQTEMIKTQGAKSTQTRELRLSLLCKFEPTMVVSKWNTLDRPRLHGPVGNTDGTVVWAKRLARCIARLAQTRMFQNNYGATSWPDTSQRIVLKHFP